MITCILCIHEYKKQVSILVYNKFSLQLVRTICDMENSVEDAHCLIAYRRNLSPFCQKWGQKVRTKSEDKKWGQKVRTKSGQSQDKWVLVRTICNIENCLEDAHLDAIYVHSAKKWNVSTKVPRKKL